MILTLHYFAHGLYCSATLEMAKVQLEILTDMDMFLMVESGIKGGICHSVI